MFLPTRYLLVVGTFCLSVLLYVDRASIATAKDAVVQEFLLTDVQWAWILASFAGAWIDHLYRRGWGDWSRKLPAIIGFLLAALGMVMSLDQASVVGAVFWLSIAIFGADMTLSCEDYTFFDNRWQGLEHDHAFALFALRDAHGRTKALST